LINLFAKRSGEPVVDRDSWAVTQFHCRRVSIGSGVNVVHLRPTYFLELPLLALYRAVAVLQQGVAAHARFGKGRHSAESPRGTNQDRVIAALLATIMRHRIGNTIPHLRTREMGSRAVKDGGRTLRGFGQEDRFQDLTVEEYVEVSKD